MTKITAAKLALAASDLKAGSATIPCLQQVKQFLSSDVISARFDGKRRFIDGSEKLEIEVDE